MVEKINSSVYLGLKVVAALMVLQLLWSGVETIRANYRKRHVGSEIGHLAI
jgi:hypothetical protein